MRSTRAFRATAVAGVVAALALVVVIGAGAGAKSGQIKNGGTLVIGLAEEPDALDPTLARTFVGRIVFLHMCEKLYDLDAKLHVVPQLAAALPQVSKDKLTYTIKLRTGIKFNDGTAFNAAAVKTSLDRHLTLKGSTRASEISPIARCDERGEHRRAPSEDAVLAADGSARRPRRDDPVAEAARRRWATSSPQPVCVGPFSSRTGSPATTSRCEVAVLLRQGERAPGLDRVPDPDRPERAHPEPAGRRHPGRRPRPVDRRADAAEGRRARSP